MTDKRSPEKPRAPKPARRPRAETRGADASTPLDVMLDNMRHYLDWAQLEETRCGPAPIGQDPDEVAAAERAAGWRKKAQDAAKDAAPYVHGRAGAEREDKHPDRISLSWRADPVAPGCSPGHGDGPEPEDPQSTL